MFVCVPIRLPFGALLVAAVIALTACDQKTAPQDKRPQDKQANAVSQASQYPAGQKPAAQTPAAQSKDAANRGSSTGQRGGPAPAVITAKVHEADFNAAVEALGTAKANEAIDIVAKASNRVTAIHFREGQYVQRGQVLLELDAEEARADLQGAEAALSDSLGQVKRARELALTQALSTQQVEQLESALQASQARVAASRARLNELLIRAPFNGRVGLRNVSLGSLVGPGTVITTLDDTSVMKLDFSVPETVLASLSAGLEVEAKSAAYAKDSFRGRVLTVGSRVDPVTRSVLVRAQIPNRDGKLKPGMFMTVRLLHGAGKALVLPEQALVPERDKQFVFGVRDGRAYKTEIVVGRRRPGEVEVLQGLSAGDEVIIEGTQKVRDGAAVRNTPVGGAEGGA